METQEVIEFLSAMVCGYADEAETLVDEINSVRTFQEAGLLTQDEGLIIRLKDDREIGRAHV